MAAVIGNTSPITASVGKARPRLARLTATPAPRRVCPMARPVVSPIATAMSRAPAEMTRCSATRVGTPAGPCQWLGSVNQAITPAIRSTRAARCASTPWRQPPLDPHEDRVHGHGQEDRCQAAEEDLGGEAVAEAFKDEEAQAAEPVAQEGGDRHEPDGRDGGEADASDHK